MLDRLFSPILVEDILAIQVPMHRYANRWIWTPKSTYKFLKDNRIPIDSMWLISVILFEPLLNPLLLLDVILFSSC